MIERKKQISLILAGGVLTLAILAALGFGLTSIARANPTNASGTGSGGVMTHMGPGFLGTGFLGGVSSDDEYLADALGVSVEELQDARQTASDAAIQAALDQGLITQEQADAMTLRGFFGGRGFHGGFGFNGGERGSVWEGIAPLARDFNYDALLAEALGVSVEELQSAREQAQDAMLAQAVADGTITQEQADLLKAQQALRSYLEDDVLLAAALGITTEQLQSFRDDELSLSEILAEVEMTAAEVRDALQVAREAAIAQAVDDGVITQDQADQILESGFHIGGLWGFGRHGGFGRGGFGGPGEPDAPALEGTGL